MEKKSPDAFRTISEVSEWLDTPAHVLRFWESRFSQVKPVKRAGGRRYYRPADMALLGGIKKLLHEDGMTIRGVQKILREQGVKHVAALGKQLEDGLIIDMEEAAPAEGEAAEPAADADVVTLGPDARVDAEPAEAMAAPAPAPETEPETPAPQPVEDSQTELAFSEPAAPAPEPQAPPLGADLPVEDPADDAMPLPPAPLTVHLRDPATRRRLYAAHRAELAESLPRLTALRDRMAQGR